MTPHQTAQTLLLNEICKNQHKFDPFDAKYLSFALCHPKQGARGSNEAANGGALAATASGGASDDTSADHRKKKQFKAASLDSVADSVNMAGQHASTKSAVMGVGAAVAELHAHVELLKAMKATLLKQTTSAAKAAHVKQAAPSVWGAKGRAAARQSKHAADGMADISKANASSSSQGSSSSDDDNAADRGPENESHHKKCRRLTAAASMPLDWGETWKLYQAMAQPLLAQSPAAACTSSRGQSGSQQPAEQQHKQQQRLRDTGSNASSDGAVSSQSLLQQVQYSPVLAAYTCSTTAAAAAFQPGSSSADLGLAVSADVAKQRIAECFKAPDMISFLQPGGWPLLPSMDSMMQQYLQQPCPQATTHDAATAQHQSKHAAAAEAHLQQANATNSTAAAFSIASFIKQFEQLIASGTGLQEQQTNTGACAASDGLIAGYFMLVSAAEGVGATGSSMPPGSESSLGGLAGVYPCQDMSGTGDDCDDDIELPSYMQQLMQRLPAPAAAAGAAVDAIAAAADDALAAEPPQHDGSISVLAITQVAEGTSALADGTAVGCNDQVANSSGSGHTQKLVPRTTLGTIAASKIVAAAAPRLSACIQHIPKAAHEPQGASASAEAAAMDPLNEGSAECLLVIDPPATPVDATSAAHAPAAAAAAAAAVVVKSSTTTIQTSPSCLQQPTGGTSAVPPVTGLQLLQDIVLPDQCEGLAGLEVFVLDGEATFSSPQAALLDASQQQQPQQQQGSSSDRMREAVTASPPYSGWVLGNRAAVAAGVEGICTQTSLEAANHLMLDSLALGTELAAQTADGLVNMPAAAVVAAANQVPGTAATTLTQQPAAAPAANWPGDSPGGEEQQAPAVRQQQQHKRSISGKVGNNAVKYAPHFTRRQQRYQLLTDTFQQAVANTARAAAITEAAATADEAEDVIMEEDAGAVAEADLVGKQTNIPRVGRQRSSTSLQLAPTSAGADAAAADCSALQVSQVQQVPPHANGGAKWRLPLLASRKSNKDSSRLLAAKQSAQTVATDSEEGIDGSSSADDSDGGNAANGAGSSQGYTGSQPAWGYRGTVPMLGRRFAPKSASAANQPTTPGDRLQLATTTAHGAVRGSVTPAAAAAATHAQAAPEAVSDGSSGEFSVGAGRPGSSSDNSGKGLDSCGSFQAPSSTHMKRTSQAQTPMRGRNTARQAAKAAKLSSWPVLLPAFQGADAWRYTSSNLQAGSQAGGKPRFRPASRPEALLRQPKVVFEQLHCGVQLPAPGSAAAGFLMALLGEQYKFIIPQHNPLLQQQQPWQQPGCQQPWQQQQGWQAAQQQQKQPWQPQLHQANQHNAAVPVQQAVDDFDDIDWDAVDALVDEHTDPQLAGQPAAPTGLTGTAYTASGASCSTLSALSNSAPWAVCTALDCLQKQQRQHLYVGRQRTAGQQHNQQQPKQQSLGLTLSKQHMAASFDSALGSAPRSALTGLMDTASGSGSNDAASAAASAAAAAAATAGCVQGANSMAVAVSLSSLGLSDAGCMELNVGLDNTDNATATAATTGCALLISGLFEDGQQLQNGVVQNGQVVVENHLHGHVQTAQQLQLSAQKPAGCSIVWPGNRMQPAGQQRGPSSMVGQQVHHDCSTSDAGLMAAQTWWQQRQQPTPHQHWQGQPDIAQQVRLQPLQQKQQQLKERIHATNYNDAATAGKSGSNGTNAVHVEDLGWDDFDVLEIVAEEEGTVMPDSAAAAAGLAAASEDLQKLRQDPAAAAAAGGVLTLDGAWLSGANGAAKSSMGALNQLQQLQAELEDLTCQLVFMDCEAPAAADANANGRGLPSQGNGSARQGSGQDCGVGGLDVIMLSNAEAAAAQVHSANESDADHASGIGLQADGACRSQQQLQHEQLQPGQRSDMSHGFNAQTAVSHETLHKLVWRRGQTGSRLPSAAAFAQMQPAERQAWVAAAKQRQQQLYGRFIQLALEHQAQAAAAATGGCWGLQRLMQVVADCIKEAMTARTSNAAGNSDIYSAAGGSSGGSGLQQQSGSHLDIMGLIARVQQEHQQLLLQQHQKMSGSTAAGAWGTGPNNAAAAGSETSDVPAVAGAALAPQRLFLALLNVAHQNNMAVANADSGAAGRASSGVTTASAADIGQRSIHSAQTAKVSAAASNQGATAVAWIPNVKIQFGSSTVPGPAIKLAK